LLLMVGDFDSASMLETVEKVFGSWSGNKPAILPSPEAGKPRGRRVHLVHVPGAVQTQILAGCHAITRKHPDWIKLGLTNSLYGGAFNSRLVMNIREDKGYTYSPAAASIRCANMAISLFPPRFATTSSPRHLRKFSMSSINCALFRFPSRSWRMHATTSVAFSRSVWPRKTACYRN